MGGLRRRAAINGDLDMGKAAVSLAAALVGLGVLCAPGASKAQPYGYPPERVEWMVGPGFFGFSGYPWPAPPLALQIPRPTYGCYFTRARLQNAWRQVEVCS
jgi:hypothetical protein